MQEKEEKYQASIQTTWVDELQTNEHVHIFKSMDWSATAFGPLRT